MIRDFCTWYLTLCELRPLAATFIGSLPLFILGMWAHEIWLRKKGE
jgi:hypothetical protein